MYWAGPGGSSEQPAVVSNPRANVSDDYYVNPEDFGFARGRQTDA
jgi:hypothetical protein